MFRPPSLRPLGRLRVPLTRRKLSPALLRPAQIRLYSYPKEGVFQPNSPPRNIPGFGPAPPLEPHGQQPPQPEPTNFPKPRRRFPRWYNILGGLICAAAGFYQIHVMFHFLVPVEPGSDEDELELEALFEELDSILLVQQLRSAQKYVEGEGYQPLWKEWTAYAGFQNDGRRHQRLTTGPLAGSSGLGAQKVFWNEEMQHLCVFINFGPSVSGWPDTVHGGAITTICDEALGRVAIKTTEAKTAVTATLEVQFLDKVSPGQWMVLMATIDVDRAAECTDRKKYITGVLGCCSDLGPSKEGDVLTDFHPHALAKGLFVVPKHVDLQPLVDEF